MELMEAIYSRRAVRSYTAEAVGRDVIERLLHAAIQAPSAVNQQPWGFVVIQDRILLRRYSDQAKATFLANAGSDSHHSHFREALSDPSFNMFHDAGTLVVICAGPGTLSPAEDCCLAGENLMLAACALGLGTCPIGLARPMLNQPEIKRELSIPSQFSAVLPIIVGFPKGMTSATPRAEPCVFLWAEKKGAE